jgi:hypothetical protein
MGARTTDVDAGWTSALWSSGDFVSAKAAAETLVEAPGTWGRLRHTGRGWRYSTKMEPRKAATRTEVR